MYLEEKKRESTGINISALLDLAGSFPVSERIRLIHVLAENLRKEHQIPMQEIIEAMKEKPSELELPISVFKQKELSCLESIVKFLKQEKSIATNDIAKILNRNQKTIWTTYRNACLKFAPSLDVSDYSFSIPVSLFQDRNFSVFELVVYYLKDSYNLSFQKISALLNRNYKTVYTIFTRARRKIRQ